MTKKQNILFTLLALLLAFSITGTIMTYLIHLYMPYLPLLLLTICLLFLSYYTGRKFGQKQKRLIALPILGVIGVVVLVWHSLDLPMYLSGQYAVVSGHPTITYHQASNSKHLVYKVELRGISDTYSLKSLPYPPDYIDYVKYHYLPHTKMIMQVEWK